MADNPCVDNAKCKDIITAMIYNHMPCLIYQYELSRYWPQGSVCDALVADFVEGLRFAHENGCPFDDNTTQIAAELGAIHCLKYAVENGCPMHPNTVASAIEYGNLACLQYAHKKGASFQAVNEVMYRVAYAGYLDILKYLYEHCGDEVKYEDTNLCGKEDSCEIPPEIREYLLEVTEDWKYRCYLVKPAKH